MNYYFEPWKKFATLSGRAPRKEFWIFVLVNFFIMFILSFPLSVLIRNLIGPISIILFPIFLLLFFIAALVPTVAVTIRRLHDTNHSEWWFFIQFVPLVGNIWLLILLLIRSQPGSNKYGSNPKEPAVMQNPPAQQAKTNWIFLAILIFVFIVPTVVMVVFFNESIKSFKSRIDGSQTIENNQLSNLAEPAVNNSTSSSDSLNVTNQKILSTAEDYAKCEKMQEESERNTCYDEIGFTKNDPVACSKITSRNGQCYIQIAIKNLDASYCEKVDSAMDKDVCYELIAKRKGDVSLCDMIKNYIRQYECKRNLSGQAYDIPSCEKKTSQNDKDQCYSDFALSNFNVSLCDKIKDETIKTACISNINDYK